MCIKSKLEEGTGRKLSSAIIPTNMKNKIKWLNILKLQIPEILSSKIFDYLRPDLRPGRKSINGGSVAGS